MKTISIIGVGRLGGALAIALSRAGFAIEKLVFRGKKPDSAILKKIDGTPPDIVHFDLLSDLTSEIVLLTVPDTELDTVSSSVAPRVAASCVVLHTSGALSSEILSPFSFRGNPVGSLHPLVSISDPITGAEKFFGAYFCVEGSSPALAGAAILVGALGGIQFTVDSASKPLYHASAVLASGHFVSLFAAAADTLTKCGVEPAKAREILLPLVKSAVKNLEQQDAPSALTGPFARTDLAAVERHLKAFDKAELFDEKNIYLELGIKALRLAAMNGGDSRQIGLIRDAIKLAQDCSR